MANSFFVPFNFQPVNTGAGNESSTYTVPTGKYARVTITMSVATTVSVPLTSTATESNLHTNADSTSFTIFLDEGEALTFTASVANTSNFSTSQASNSDSSSIIAKVDGVNIATIRCYGGYSFVTSGGNISLSVSGSAEADFRYEEYNKIS